MEPNWQSYTKRALEPKNRWLWLCFVCSMSLMFVFNNCGEITTLQQTRSGNSAEQVGQKQDPQAASLVGELIQGLEGLEVRDFKMAESGQHVLIEAREVEPLDVRESGLYKAFLFGVQDKQLKDLCDNRLAQRLFNDCYIGDISKDGQVAAISTKDALVGTSDRDLDEDIFLVQTAKVSRKVFEGGVSGFELSGEVAETVLSKNGSSLAFATKYWDISENNEGFQQVYFKDKKSKTVRAVSVSRTGELANGDSWGLSLSENARFLLFHSDATNLLPQVYDGSSHIYLKDLKTGQLTWVDEPRLGQQPREDTHSFGGRLSADGRYVIFVSEAGNLVSDDKNGFTDIFLKDLRADVTELVSRTPGGQSSNGDCSMPQVSKKAEVVTFVCEPMAFGLQAEIGSPEVFWVSRADNKWRPLKLPADGPVRVYKQELSADGRHLIMGLRSASATSTEAEISLVKYQF